MDTAGGPARLDQLGRTGVDQLRRTGLAQLGRTASRSRLSQVDQLRRTRSGLDRPDCDTKRDTWRTLPSAHAPSSRAHHSAIWTGSEMIVWGGAAGAVEHADGAAYSPARQRWRTISGEDAPGDRSGHGAVWTGSEMIVWGGTRGAKRLRTGGRYDPNSDTWTALPTEGAPEGCRTPAVAWTKAGLLVWGRGQGAVWSPGTNQWSPVCGDAAFGVRERFGHTWTGTGLLIIGGEVVEGRPTERTPAGAVYYPDTDSWQHLTLRTGKGTGASLAGLLCPRLVWTDRTAFLLGGYGRLGARRSVAKGGAWSIDPKRPSVTPR